MFPKKDVIILLSYLGLQSNQISKRLKSCIYQFYSCVNLKIIFQNTCRIKSFFPYKDRLNHSQRSNVVYKACCWYCNDFYIGKTKRRLHDRKTEHFKSLTKNDHSSAIANHVAATGRSIKWDHFEILPSGKTDYHCNIKKHRLFKTLSQLLMSTSAVKSWCFISGCLLYSLFLISFPDNFWIYSVISLSHHQK